MPSYRSDAGQLLTHTCSALEWLAANALSDGKFSGENLQAINSVIANIRSKSNIDRIKEEWRVGFPPFQIEVLNTKENEHGHNPILILGGNVIGLKKDINQTNLSLCVAFTTVKDDYLMDDGKKLNTYSCCLPGNKNRMRIVRRFHFDFQPKDKKHPEAHFQYGGEIPQEGFYDGTHYCLEHFLEEPRVLYPPMDFVLLLDLAVMNFNTSLFKLKSETRWNKLVRESEKLCWKGYFKRTSDYLDKSTRTNTIHEMYYERKTTS